MKVLLLRHPPVATAWQGRCYGRSDMGWSRAGWAMARRIVGEIGPVDAVIHSGAIRTRRLADRIGAAQRVAVTADPRWLERDFAAWEGRTWDAIWRDGGADMDRMMTDPESYRPGGGETGRALAGRVQAAWDALPDAPTVLVVAHGGPIATLRTLHAGAPLTQAVDFIPACGEVVTLQRRQ